MKNIVAVLFGSLFIFVVGLTLELIFIVIAVGFVQLVKLWPFLSELGIYFRYILGIPIFILLMFLGGYITAAIARQQVLLNCFIVASLTIGITFTSALSYSVLTVSGTVVIILALLATVAGGRYWQRKSASEFEGASENAFTT